MFPWESNPQPFALLTQLFTLTRITAMEASKQTGSDIADSTWLKKPTHPSKKLYDQRHICHLCLFLLRVLNLATHVSIESEEKQLSTIFFNLERITHFNC